MIAFENAALGYPGKTVFANLNWTLPHRGTIALMGPSGGGKTTLLRALAGLLPPLSGRVEGLENKKIAVLFQEDRLLPWLTAEKNAALAGGLAGARHWLAQMEIDAPGQYPREMSGGMQRRAALARATEGATISVHAGTYEERLTVGKRVMISAEDGAGTAPVRAHGDPHAVHTGRFAQGRDR